VAEKVRSAPKELARRGLESGVERLRGQLRDTAQYGQRDEFGGDTLEDILVFATPVYYYCVSGQLKTMLDRANPLYDSDYAFTKVYLLATAAEDGPHTVEGTVKAVQGWVDCFDRCELADTVFAGGVEGVGAISGHPALTRAYQLGRAID
jgi:hypothetical protein